MPSRGRRRLLATMAVTLVVAGCSGFGGFGGFGGTGGTGDRVVGAGPVRTDTRSVGEVTRLAVGHGIRVQVVIGSPATVRLEAQENLLPITTTTTSGDRLTIGTTRNYTTTSGILATVTVPRLDEIGVEGGASGEAFGVHAGALVVKAEGGAVLAMSGTADALELRGEGGAALDLARLTTRSAAIDLDGGVVLKLAATESVTGTADGGVVVRLTGSPPTVNVQANGGSVVIRE